MLAGVLDGRELNHRRHGIHGTDALGWGFGEDEEEGTTNLTNLTNLGRWGGCLLRESLCSLCSPWLQFLLFLYRVSGQIAGSGVLPGISLP